MSCSNCSTAFSAFGRESSISLSNCPRSNVSVNHRQWCFSMILFCFTSVILRLVGICYSSRILIPYYKNYTTSVILICRLMPKKLTSQILKLKWSFTKKKKRIRRLGRIVLSVWLQDWNICLLPFMLLVSGLQTWTEFHHQLCWMSSLQTAAHGNSQPP